MSYAPSGFLISNHNVCQTYGEKKRGTERIVIVKHVVIFKSTASLVSLKEKDQENIDPLDNN